MKAPGRVNEWMQKECMARHKISGKRTEEHTEGMKMITH